MKYEIIEKPYWKRLDFSPENHLSFKEYSKANIELLNIEQEGIKITDYDDVRPLEYRGLGEYYEMENKERLNHNIGLTIDKNLEKMIAIKFELDENNDTLVNGISIDMKDNSSAKILIFYESKAEVKNYHNAYVKVNMGKNSNLELINLQNLNGLSYNFTQTDFITQEDSNLEYYDLELGSKLNAVSSKARLIGDRSNVLYTSISSR